MNLPDLGAYAQPAKNDTQTVSDAIQALIEADNEERSERAYHRLLYAAGNNHAGTYFPVVLGVIHALGVVLRTGAPWAQRTALEVLIDWFGAFEPEAGHEVFQGEALMEKVRQAIRGLRPSVDALAQSGSVAQISAIELLDALNGGDYRAT